MHALQIAGFLDDFSAWASARADILAVALVGSQARGTAKPDSDVDLVIVARDPQAYLQDTAWAERFGAIARQQIEDYGLVQSLRVWYQGGPEVEYGFTDERWTALPLDAGTQRVMADGLRVLFERAPILSRHLPVE